VTMSGEAKGRSLYKREMMPWLPISFTQLEITNFFSRNGVLDSDQFRNTHGIDKSRAGTEGYVEIL